MDQKQMLEVLDLMKGELNETDIAKIAKAAKMISDPNKITPQVIAKILNEVGIDLDTLQKKARKARAKVNANKPKKVKIGRNAPCPCKSGKKHKKCCGM